MKAENRKKLAAIKKKVIVGQWVNSDDRAKGKRVDENYATALQTLGKAIQDIEYMYGDLD